MNVASDIIGYVSIGFSVFFALLVLFSTFKGYRRGILRQSIRTATIVISMIAAIIIIRASVGMLTDACQGNTISEAIEQLGAGALLDTMDGETVEILESLSADKVLNLVLVPVASIAFPIAFTLLFIVISAVLYVIYGIVCIFVKGLSKKRNSGKTRLFGALLGLVQGFVVATVCFLPVNNILDIADTAVTSIRQADTEESSELTELYDEYVSPLYNFPMRTSMTLGGRLIADTVSTIEIDGESYNTRQPILTIAEVYSDASRLKDADFVSLSKKDQKIIRDIEETLFKDKFFTSSVAGLLSSFGDLADDGLIALEIEGNAKEFFDAFLYMFKSSTVDTVEDDFDTVLDVMFFMINEGVMDAIANGTDEDIIDIMTKSVDYNGKNATTLAHISAILDENPHTHPIVTALTKFSLTVMSDFLNFGEQLDEVYETIKDDIDTLNHSTNRSEIKTTLDDIFAEHNINIEDEVLAEMTNFIYDEYTSQGKTITEDDMSDIIFSYYDAYVAAGAGTPEWE